MPRFPQTKIAPRGAALGSAWVALLIWMPEGRAAPPLAPINLRIAASGSAVADPAMPPLSWDDPRFADTVASGPLRLRSGESVSDLSIDDQSGDRTITCLGSCSVTRVRMTAREGPRCVSGSINLTSMWIETKGQGDDHADGLQCYKPGGTGTVTVKSTTFRSHTESTHTGYWSADDWRGNHVFEDVLFWGGTFGLRIPFDGGSSVRLKKVYFVKDSFPYAAYQLDIPILQWENVRWVTIEHGKMLMRDPIPRPW